MSKITARKVGGDDAYSWAVLIDGRVAFSGLSKPEVAYYKRLTKEISSQGKPHRDPQGTQQATPPRIGRVDQP